MKLSLAAELAVRGAIVLAEEYGHGPTTLGEVCTRRDLPKQYLVKIFSSLARAGLITPTRGKGGGYVLARPPGEINLLQVIEAIEGRIAVNYCQAEPPQCDNVGCPVSEVWRDVQQMLCARLGGMTMADCVNGKPSASA